jgi:hypothetical protein
LFENELHWGPENRKQSQIRETGIPCHRVWVRTVLEREKVRSEEQED